MRQAEFVMPAPPAAPLCTFHVNGVPRPQGSMRAVSVKGRARLIHAKGGDLAVWREAVTNAAARAWDGPPIDGPVCVYVNFYLPRGTSIPRKITRPQTRPDLDKLIRAVLDSLEGTLLTDDARVVTIVATKQYAVTEGAGALIRVEGVA